MTSNSIEIEMLNCFFQLDVEEKKVIIKLIRKILDDKKTYMTDKSSLDFNKNVQNSKENGVRHFNQTTNIINIKLTPIIEYLKSKNPEIKSDEIGKTYIENWLFNELFNGDGIKNNLKLEIIKNPIEELSISYINNSHQKNLLVILRLKKKLDNLMKEINFGDSA